MLDWQFMRRLPFWCALGIAVALACSGRNSDQGVGHGASTGSGATAGTGASGGGNTAGMGGAGGQGATGASGGGAGTRGPGDAGSTGTIDSGVEWGACTGPGQCELVTAKCCACGEIGLGQLVAVNSSQRDAFSKAICGNMPPCPPCVGTIAPNLIAVCEAGRCRGIDIQSDPTYTKCGNDQDCTLRSGLGCCECPETGEWVPISHAGSILVKSQVCAPSTGCPKCIPTPPLETRPICRNGVCGKILIPVTPFSSTG
jgi:hypothetical protein